MEVLRAWSTQYSIRALGSTGPFCKHLSCLGAGAFLTRAATSASSGFGRRGLVGSPHVEASKRGWVYLTAASLPAASRRRPRVTFSEKRGAQAWAKIKLLQAAAKSDAHCLHFLMLRACLRLSLTFILTGLTALLDAALITNLV